MKKLHSIIAFLLFCSFGLLPTLTVADSTQSALNPWKATSSPYSAVTVVVHGKDIYIPYSDATTSSIAATVICLIGDTCRTTWPAGGGSAFDPFSHLTNYNLTMSATTSAQWGKLGFYGSSSNAFDSATTTYLRVLTSLWLPLTNSGLGVDANGLVYAAATSTLANISGTLGVTRGGTGQTTTASSSILFGAPGNTTVYMATSSLGVNVSDLKAAGTNGFGLALVNGVPTFVATTTFAGSGCVTTTYGANNTWTIGCTASGGTDPFSHTTAWGSLVSSTGTPLFDTNGFIGSSTSRFDTLIVYATTSTSTLANLNGEYWITDPTTDFGTQVMNLYNGAWGDQVTINVARGIYSQNVATHPINANTLSRKLLLRCAPGDGTVINLTGAGTSTILNAGNNGTTGRPGLLHTGYGIDGCTFNGNLTAGQVGIQIGGVNGAQGALIKNTNVFNTDIGIVVADQTAGGFNIDGVNSQYNNKNFQTQMTTNGGEGINISKVNFSDCQTGHTNKCVDFSSTIGSSIHLSECEIDDAQLYVGDGNLRLAIDKCHFENPNVQAIGSYTFILTNSGGYGALSVTNSSFWNGATTSAKTPYSFISAGDPIHLFGNSFASNNVVMGSVVQTYGNGRLLATGNFYPQATISAVGIPVFSTSTAVDFLVDPLTNNFGIASSTPYAKLSVNANGATPSFIVGSSSASLMYVNGRGDLLVGTTTNTSTQPAKIFIDMGNSNTSENIINAVGNLNDFINYNCQNKNIGTSAECGYAATSDIGTNTSGFIYMGANNSKFWNPQTYTIGGPNDTDILSLAGDMFIANGTTTTKNMNFLTGGVSTSTNLRMTILGTGNVGIGTSSPYSALSVNGQVVMKNLVSTSTSATSTIAGALTVGAGQGTSTFGGGVSATRFSQTATSTGTVGWDISGGCYSVNNVCLTSGSLPSVGGTGAIQYANGTAFAGDNTKFFYDSTNNDWVLGQTSSATTSNTVKAYIGDTQGTINSNYLLGKLLLGTTSSQYYDQVNNKGSIITAYGQNVTNDTLPLVYITGSTTNSNTFVVQNKIADANMAIRSTAGYGAAYILTYATANEYNGTRSYVTADALAYGFGRQGTSDGYYVMNSDLLPQQKWYNTTFDSSMRGGLSVGTTTDLLGNPTWARLGVQGKFGSQAPIFDVATTTNSSGSATTSVFRIKANGGTGIATSTFSGLFGIGTTGSTNGSSTIASGKIQWDGYNSAGTRICAYFVGTTLTVSSAACVQ